MEKRPRRTPAEKARAQYTNYAVKEPMELMEFRLIISGQDFLFLEIANILTTYFNANLQ